MPPERYRPLSFDEGTPKTMAKFRFDGTLLGITSFFVGDIEASPQAV